MSAFRFRPIARSDYSLLAHWLRQPHVSLAKDLVVPVHVENIASWRALERAGFMRPCEGELEPDNPVDSRDHYVYVLARSRGRFANPAYETDRP